MSFEYFEVLHSGLIEESGLLGLNKCRQISVFRRFEGTCHFNFQVFKVPSTLEDEGGRFFRNVETGIIIVILYMKRRIIWDFQIPPQRVHFSYPYFNLSAHLRVWCVSVSSYFNQSAQLRL